jgi:hypothetical protein
MGKVGYSLEYESYPNYQTFSFLENYGSMQLSKFFQTRTTLQVGMDAGRRSYLNLDGDSGGDYVTQMTASAKIAQSLADHTGVQLQYLWHRAPKSIADDQYREIGYYSVEDILEDEYDYSSHKYQVTLKHIGPWRTVLKGTLSKENRKYNNSSSYIAYYDDFQEIEIGNIPTFARFRRRFLLSEYLFPDPTSYATEEVREDSNIAFFLEVEKKFSLPLSSFQDMALHIEFLHRKSDSSDPYYDHSTNMLSIGTKVAF